MRLMRYALAAAVMAALAVSPTALAHHQPDHAGGPPATVTPGQGNPGQDPTPGQGNPTPGQDPNPGQGNPTPGQDPNPGQGNPNPGQDPNPGQGNPNPGQGNPNPGQGNPNPGQGNQGNRPQGPPPHGVAAGHDKIALCHATGSETNPFSIIEIPRKQWEKEVGHGSHDHDFPLPANGQCEGHVASLPGTAAAAGVPPTEPGEVIAPVVAGEQVATIVAGEVVTTAAGETIAGDEVLGSGLTRPGEAVRADVLASHQGAPDVAAARTTGALPFTGADDKEVLFTGFGLSLILIGIGAWGLTKPSKALQI